MMKAKPLPRTFYDRATLKVAKDLLGKYLIRDSGQLFCAARITDVEAYIGQEDRACHASKGRTPRTEVMFGPSGIAYVYLIYGMYHCLNFVTERLDYPAAVLIRGIEVTQVTKNGVVLSHTTRIDGPGRICRFLSIDRTLNKLDTTLGQSLWVEDRGNSVPKTHIQTLPRIGITYAGEWAEKPWRFCLSVPTLSGHVNPKRTRTPAR